MPPRRHVKQNVRTSPKKTSKIHAAKTVDSGGTKQPRTSVEIYRDAFAEATVPQNITSRSLGDESPIISTDSVFRPPFQCHCSSLEHCGKTATIHPEGCDICTGEISCPVRGVTRLYPKNVGWDRLRRQVKSMRNAAGLSPVVKPEREIFWPHYRNYMLGLNNKPLSTTAYEGFFPKK